MKIVIVGAGAVGMLVASYLSKSYEVIVVTRREEQAETIKKHGLIRVNLDGTTEKCHVSVCTNLLKIPNDSLVIVTVKYNSLQHLYKSISMLNRNIPLLFLQNGLAHFNEALDLPQKIVAFGSCQFGAERKNDYTVIHRGSGLLKIALERGDKQVLSIFNQWNKPYFPVVMEENAEKMLFEKALLNCFINPLTAILNVKNGQLLEGKHSMFLLQTLYEELMQAFPEERAHFPFEKVIRLCQDTAKNTSSMLSDRLHGRKTEAETILGAIIEKAKQRGHTLPTLISLYHIILSIEESGGLCGNKEFNI